MSWQSRYEAGKSNLLVDQSICAENRQLFAEFFAFEEYKLKRQNGLPILDTGCYNTLYGYVFRFRNVNDWFGNKPWKDLTKDEIKNIYDGLEDGRILNRSGKPYKDRQSYYNKVFKSKPFRLAGKSEFAKDVIEFSTSDPRTVRYLTEEGLRLLASVLTKPRHLFLFWLAWDIGENIGTLLQLTKRDIIPQLSRHANEREYLVNLPRSKLKRSRQARSEPTLYSETVRYGDMVLPSLGPDDPLFTFGHRAATKILDAAAKKTRATTMPYNDKVRWKDFRSGMACHLLRNGWSRDEVNARLGHTPHSDALDAYINFLALDRDKPKQRLLESNADALRVEVARLQQATRPESEYSGQAHDATTVLRAELERLRLELKREKELPDSPAEPGQTVGS